jgi:HK97 gp10 family phage protein
MDISYKLKGLNKTIRRVEKMSKKAQIEVANDIKFAALDTESLAKKKAPINKAYGVGGLLRSSIIANFLAKFSWAVGSDKDYASHVEYGTRAHVIKIKNKKGLSDGTNFFGKSVQHPGTQAQPFLRPAYNKAINNLKKQIKLTISRL